MNSIRETRSHPAQHALPHIARLLNPLCCASPHQGKRSAGRRRQKLSTWVMPVVIQQLHWQQGVPSMRTVGRGRYRAAL